MNGNKLASGAIVLIAMLCNDFSGEGQGQAHAQQPKPLYLDASQPIDLQTRSSLGVGTRNSVDRRQKDGDDPRFDWNIGSCASAFERNYS
jgi:hypothetical protein